MPSNPCPMCGHPPCNGTERVDPHHRLCCLDGQRRACWGEMHPDDRAALEESRRRGWWE